MTSASGRSDNRTGWLAACLWLITGAAWAAPPSNLLVILTDNHGEWTLGCYGNRGIATPHIDGLAAGGARFTRAFANNAVCSPTRATFLTGLMPSGHGVHCYLGANGLQVGPRARSTMDDLRTLPEILADRGYECGLVGKWHLGDNTRPQEGFTTWVTMPHGATATFHGAAVIEAGAIRREPAHLTEFWTRRAIEFLERPRDRPFFLLLAFNGPYGLGPSMLEEPRNRHAARYAGEPPACFPKEPMHPWLRATTNLFHSATARRRYASEISGIDDGVGEVLGALGRLGLDGRTTVVLTADQGLACGQHGLWGMGDHTRPLSAYEWTMRVPLIWRQPGQIPAGQTIDLMVSHCDAMPTLLDWLGFADDLPRDPPRPGRSYAAALRGKPMTGWDSAIFFEFENVRAIRTERWKLVERIHEGPTELYDLATDPDERQNLAADPAHRAGLDALRERSRAFFARHADPKWDLWNGGRSKSNLITRELFGIDNPERAPPGPKM